MSDAFPNLQGPVVPISIFGEAATAGTNVGKAIPSTTQAVIEGGIKGFKQGLDFVQEGQQIKANDQNAQIRQNEINQIPITNQIQRQQLERSQNINEIQQLELEQQQQTQDLAIQNKKAQLENDTSKQAAELETRQQADSFTDDMKLGGKMAVDAVLGGKYAKLFAQKPEYYKQGLQNIYANPALTPEQRQGISTYLKKSQATDYYAKEAEKRKQKWTDAQSTFNDSTFVGDAADKLGITPEEVADAVEFVPKGKYVLDENNRIQMDPAGGRQFNSQWDPKIDQGYDVVSKDGTVIYPGASKDDYKNYTAYRRERSYQDGSFGKRAANSVSGANTKPQGIQKPQLNPFGQTQSNINPNEPRLDPFDAEIGTALKIAPETVKEISQPLSTLKEQIVRYNSDPRVRGTSAGIRTVNEAVNTTARFVADKEFKESKALQSQYTQADVDAYNNSISTQFYGVLGRNPTLARAFGITSGMRGPGGETFGDLTNALKASSPADLYYMTRRKALEPAIKGVVTSAIDKNYQSKQRVLRKQVSNQQTLDFLTATANGSK